MTALGGMGGGAITIRRIGIDDHSNVRYLHTKSMIAQSVDALSQAEIEAFVAFVGSPAYSDCLIAEDVYGAFVDGQSLLLVEAGDDQDQMRVGWHVGWHGGHSLVTLPITQPVQ